MPYNTEDHRRQNRKPPYKLNQLDWKILILSSNQEKKITLTMMSKKLEKSLSYLSERVTRLVNEGYLTKRNDGFLNLELTKKGKDTLSVFLRGYKKGSVERKIRLHSFKISFPIIRKGSLFSIKDSNNWIKSNHSTWRGYIKYFKEGGHVFVSPRAVRVYAPPIYDFDPEEAFARAKNYCLSVKAGLEQQFNGLVLGKPERVGRVTDNHYALEFDPFARLCERVGYSFEDERRKNDSSKGFPEHETLHKDFGLDDCVTIDSFYDYLVRNGRQRLFESGADLFDICVILAKRLEVVEGLVSAVINRFGLNLKSMRFKDADLRDFVNKKLKVVE